LSFSLAAYAETPEIKGQVLDPTSAVVPNARVLLIELATLETRLVTTDREGRFSFSNNLTYPEYEVKVACPGFVTHSEQVRLQPRGNVVVVPGIQTMPADGVVAPEAKPTNVVTLKIKLKIGST
jgi:hypothetical protein